MKRLLFLPFFIICVVSDAQHYSVENCDVLVIGGGTGGTAAALQSARLGAKTVLVESGDILGGMLTAAGVSCTDGNEYLDGGIWNEFRQLLYKHYNNTRLNTGWVSNTCFEPHVGDSIFKAMASREKNLRVYYGYNLYTVTGKNQRLTGAVFIDNLHYTKINIQAKIVIDATETGDVMAMAHVPYDLGMDDPAVSGETEAREKNNIIQDLTWAAVLKEYDEKSDHTIPRPEGYNPSLYFCSCLNAPCDKVSWDGDVTKMLRYGRLPLTPGQQFRKYMINWPAHGNDIYLNVVESDSADRNAAYKKAKLHTLGFIYFIQTALKMKNFGLAEDELNNGLAWIPYNREGRRLRGAVRMNLDHIKDPYRDDLYKTGISCGDYPVDHHHAQYPGKVPDIKFPPIPAYNIPMGVLIPEKMDGLLVCEKGISVTNLVNGTTRLQPVVLATGQATGALAALSVKYKKDPRNLPVRILQQSLLEAHCYLMPFTDVPILNPNWAAIQQAGLCGILKGTGKPMGWSNKMYFYPDSMVTGDDLLRFKYAIPDNGLRPPLSIITNDKRKIVCRELEPFFSLASMRIQLKKNTGSDALTALMRDSWKRTFGREYLPDEKISRGDFARLIQIYFPQVFESPVTLINKR